MIQDMAQPISAVQSRLHHNASPNRGPIKKQSSIYVNNHVYLSDGRFIMVSPCPFKGICLLYTKVV